MEKKILILGAKGMLGGYLANVFSDLNPVLWDKEDLDITDSEDVSRKITELKPDVIINSAAYTAVDDCETNKKLAGQINGEAVKYLACVAGKTGAIFIHYSTDYVFDGRNFNGYKENDASKESVNVYGESKLLGERYIMSLSPKFQVMSFKFYIIRTSWLYGKGGSNFVDTMLRLGETRKQLKVVNDQHGKPTYARDLAKRTRELLEKNYESGIYHITNETENIQTGITWYDFAGEIFSIANRKIELTPCDSTDFSRPAKRPEWSALSNTKLPVSRNWRRALRMYLSELLIGDNRVIMQLMGKEENNRENNREMRDLTAAVFRVAEGFNGGEFLKKRTQEKALDIFEKSNPHFDDASIKDIGVMKNFLSLAKDMDLTKAINCDVLIVEYDRLLARTNINTNNNPSILIDQIKHGQPVSEKNRRKQKPLLTERQKKILKLFKNKKELRLKDIRLFFSDVTSRTLRNDLKGLSKNDYLIRNGLGAGSVYYIT